MRISYACVVFENDKSKHFVFRITYERVYWHNWTILALELGMHGATLQNEKVKKKYYLQLFNAYLFHTLYQLRVLNSIVKH